MSCPPGHEAILEQEILQFAKLIYDPSTGQPFAGSIRITRAFGGIDLLDFPPSIGFELNHYLKTAHRILWRVREFTVLSFEDLATHLGTFDFFNFDEISLEIAAASSRLNNEKRIREVFQARLKSKLVTDSKNTFYVRNYENRMTISLDTTGEHLYRRNYKHLTAIAPLRETLASYLLLILLENKNTQAVMNRESVTLLDPLMGSGTFLTEAARLLLPNDLRTFAYEAWAQPVPPAPRARGYESPRKIFDHLLGFEIDEDAFQIFPAGFESEIEIHNVDFFSSRKIWERRSNIILISNLPYDRRLKGFNYDRFFEYLREFRPRHFGILMNEKHLPQARAVLHDQFELAKPLRVINGGLRCSFLQGFPLSDGLSQKLGSGPRIPGPNFSASEMDTSRGGPS